MSTVHTVSVCTSVVLAALASFPAAAELPMHPRVAVFQPAPLHAGSFGSAVAIRNGIAFVGNFDGLPTPYVDIFGLTSTGSWVRTGKLLPPDAASVADFGRAIVFRDGLVLIASARAVHVFKRSNGVWTAVQKLTPPPIDGPPDLRQFPIGTAMRYENGILAIGSLSYTDRTFVDAVSVVYVYERDATGKLVRRATLKAADTSPNDQFGTSVGVAGSEVVVGAPSVNAAYVFRRRSDGRWVETQKLQTADTPARGAFGSAVAIDRGMIVVGAPSFDCVELGGEHQVPCNTDPSGEFSAAGAAFGFVPVAGSYTEIFKLRPRPDDQNQQFGYWDFGSRIVMMGNLIGVGAGRIVYGQPAERFDSSGGLVFTYRRDGSTVSARGIAGGYPYTVRSFRSAWGIALANNWLLVGATENFGCLFEHGEEECIGAAHLFDLSRVVQ